MEGDMVEAQGATSVESRPQNNPTTLRRRLLSSLPVTERRLELAGISTPVLEGGEGPPVVLLHGPFGYAAHWMFVIPSLAKSHRVIAPDLPGHGASEMSDASLHVDRVLAWLGQLIDQTCDSSPALVGQLLGGAIAARFAAGHRDRVSRLALIDTFGLVPFQPEPEFGKALHQFMAHPDERTHHDLWRHCAFDLDGLLQRIGERWDTFASYNVDRVRTPSVQAAAGTLMELFAVKAIPEGELARSTAPTTLIWGRNDRATPLSAAEAASARFGWALNAIDACADDPPIERPEALLRLLLSFLGGRPQQDSGRGS
jgi:pimeloyl-ACP methyl ester carboxylesterase